MNDTPLSYLKGRRTTLNSGCTMVDFLRRNAEAWPDNTALVHKDFSITYRRFDLLTDLLAAELARRGLTRGARAGILAGRNELGPLAVFGITKAAAAYVPLNPAYPPARLMHIIRDAGIDHIIADEGLEKSIPEFKGTLINGREFLRASAAHQDSPPAVPGPPGPDDLMTVLYTSGSTGIPKGVMLNHRSAVDNIACHKNLIPLMPGDAAASYVSLSFSMHMADMFPALMAGAAVHIIDDDTRLDTGKVNAYLEANNIILGVFPFGFGSSLVLHEKNKSLRALVMGGEGFMPLPELSLNYKVYNAYGCTECCGANTMGEVKPGDTHISAGTPMDNIDMFILDDKGGIVRRGEKGELCIAGPVVGRGYLNQPEKTAEVFVQNPFNNEAGYERYYKTGDLARITEDGEIEILGRVDFQIKIRGYRIEGGEIDARIRQYPGIHESVTVAAENKAGKQLVSYIAAGKKIGAAALRDFISGFLPPYMVPRFIEQIDKLPRNINGKIDRGKLPPPSFIGGIYTPPETEAEKKLARLWAAVLGLEAGTISRDADFFELGGDSLRATILGIEISKTFAAGLSPAEIFNKPLLKEEAALLGTAKSFTGIHVFRDTGERPPLFFVHGGNIGPEAFEPLAGKLPPDQPFYCFENYNMYHPRSRIKGIEAVAARYIEFMRSVAPRGPYAIGGWSYGALAAFEMALQIEGLGERAAHLYLLDPSLIRGEEEKRLRKKFLELNDYQEYLARDPLFEGFRKLGFLDRLVENNREVGEDMLNYVPSGAYGGEVTLFKAVKAEPVKTGLPPEAMEALIALQRMDKEKPDNGFGEYAPRLRVIEIPEIHDGFMRGDALDTIARVIGGREGKGGGP